jgi:glycosyltransferase involved in cell wall biosynthesis
VVVPWGANIEALPADALTYDLDLDQVRLLLVGRDWWAKGGPFVIEVLRGLIDKGIDARLSVVGTTPPANELEDHIDVYPNLDKSISEDAQTLEELFKSAHFMVQPSLESYGFAFCEASAFALPSLCMKRGGIPVWDGVNGHALPVESSPEDFVDVIADYRRNSKAYTALRHSTRSCFDEKLNWAAWGADVKQQLETLVLSDA